MGGHDDKTEPVVFAEHNFAKFYDNSGPVHSRRTQKRCNIFGGRRISASPTGELRQAMGLCQPTSTPISRCVRTVVVSSLAGAVLLFDGAISWFAKAQKVAASASPGSEYRTLATIVKEVKFLRQVKELCVARPRTL